MKKIFLLLLLIACAPIAQQEITPTPVHYEPPAIMEKPARPPLNDNIMKHIIMEQIKPYTLVSTNAIYDSFSIIPAERYDALYQADITALVHVFKFSTREELKFVMDSEFYSIINLGTTRHQGQTLAIYLSQENHRIAVWTSGNFLILIETYIPDYVERDLLNAYLYRYPSDLETEKCIDSDGPDHLIKGTTNRVKVDGTTMEWTDVCYRDSPLYKNKQYISRKGLSQEDGLLEGRCEYDAYKPGYIEEYACHRGCEKGVCKLV
jgi:hypothetical protein